MKISSFKANLTKNFLKNIKFATITGQIKSEIRKNKIFRNGQKMNSEQQKI